MGFKENFVWGAAAASYQIEGAAFEDGKGLSVWDVFTEEAGNVFLNHTGNVACDHYHRYKEDVKIMSDIGLDAYRLSLSWPRILPDGIGKINEKGLDFYDRLIDELLEKNIKPYVTLFHWDLPYELHKKGAWLNPDISDWFAEYTRVVVDRLSDRVSQWMTLNEPQVFIGNGHIIGNHAPGLKMSKRDLITMIHNTLITHGKSAAIIRENSKLPAQIGYAPCLGVPVPNTNSERDIKAAQEAFFGAHFIDEKDRLVWDPAIWMDPVFLGKYPENYIKKYEHLLPNNYQEDMSIINHEIDFYGVNIYSGRKVAMDNDGQIITIDEKDGNPRNALNWSVLPETLYWASKFAYERYKKPIYITENGLSLRDWVSLDGKVHDPNRIDFLTRYLQQYKKAADDGIDLAGYFQWSIMDNFEWTEGYKERFGLVYVDYETGKRTLKDSAYWYRDVIKSNGENL